MKAYTNFYVGAMSILFISDLHLDPEEPATVQIFLNFLQTQVRQAEALYILGDFFEVWIGDDDHTSFNQKIAAALKTLVTQGTAVYFMPGNRDFLLGKDYLQPLGCQLLTDPTLIDIYGVPTLLMHGDTLCTDDIRYLRFRRIVRNRWCQRLFLALPLSWRKKIAYQLRQQSQRTQMLADATMHEIKRVMEQYKASLLIHGHTHRPSIQYFDLNDQKVCRIVLSDWHNSGNVLACYPNGEYRLMVCL